jgi:hypothetical protein
MTSYDLFPIEKLPPRARSAILMEFNGRCPSRAEMASVSDAEWLKLPGVGPTVLMTMHQIRQQESTQTRLTDAELLAERDRLRASLRLQNQRLGAVMAELRVRNLLPHQEKPQRRMPPYASLT